jgi:hypothetical protein
LRVSLRYEISNRNRRSNLRINTAVVLRGVGHLGPFTPDNLTGSGNKTQLGDVDLNDCSLGQDTQLGIERVLGVLLDGQDRELHSDSQLGTEQTVSIPYPTKINRRAGILPGDKTYCVTLHFL